MKKDAAPYPADALAVGTELDGYRIESMLGRGAFGITYLAKETQLDRLVAIKEYLPIDFAVREKDRTVHSRPGSQGDLFQYGLDSFLKEAKTLVKFKHHNIVRVLTFLEENRTAYIVMEYEVGRDLKSYYKEQPQPSEAELLAIFLPVNEGLAVVHDYGFIHRDIKPDNIYIRKDQSPVLLDFGAARDVVKTKPDQLTRIMTEGYAPYEQYNPAWKNQGPWTDIYALGATLYVGVMGRKPVSASQRAAAYMQQTEDTYVSAQQAADKGYSRSFLAAIDKALAFNPEHRPQSLSEWNQMLRGDLDVTVIKPSTIPSRHTSASDIQVNNNQVTTSGDMQSQGSKPWLLISTAAALIILAVMGGIYFLFVSENALLRGSEKKETGIQSNIAEDLVNSAMVFAKTSCWHYARINNFNALIEKIKNLPSTNDRTQFIADQMMKIKESEKGFEKNFSQYSISIIKLRRYPVESTKQAIQNFLQLPDYRNDRAYNLLGQVITEHATGDTLNTDKWRKDFIDISINSGAFN